MKKALIIALTVLGATPAFAEKITCNFTEPFIQVTIDTEKGTGVLLNQVEDNAQNYTGLKVQSFGNDKYQIELGDNALVLNMAKEGSDGMSDLIYPIDGMLLGPARESALYGGCFTDSKRPRCEGEICD